MFLNPMFLDSLFVFYPLSMSYSNIGHPTLFSKSKRNSPEFDEKNYLSFGCFPLSILLNIDSGMFASFIK